MKEPDSSTIVGQGEAPIAVHRRRRRRRVCLALSFCLLFILFLAILALVLALTLFKFKDPTSKLVSARVRGVSPRVSLPTLRIELNITLDLQLRIHNPNRVSFSHAPGKSILSYRGEVVGEADVAQGKIPERGDEVVEYMLAVEADRLVSQLGNLLRDVIAGEVGFDTTTRMPGRLTFLGFIKHHAVSMSECHLVMGLPELQVKRQDCTQKTKL